MKNIQLPDAAHLTPKQAVVAFVDRVRGSANKDLSISALTPEERDEFYKKLELYNGWANAPAGKKKDAIARATAAFQAFRQPLGLRSVEALFREVANTGDYMALAPQPRADRGTLRAWDPEAVVFLLRRYVKCLQNQLAYDGMERDVADTALRYGSKRSADRIIAKFKSWYDDMLTLNRSKHDYKSLHQVPILRDYTKLMPNEVWVSDHHQLDVLCVWPDGSLVRPWLCVWQDVRTRMLLTYTISKSPDSKSVADSLYHAFRLWGFPEKLYTDNGWAYDAKVLSGTKWTKEETGYQELPSNIITAIDAVGLGMYGLSDWRCALPFNPQSKVIERYFGIGGLSDWAKQIHPGFTGRRYDDMPDDLRRELKKKKPQLYTLEQILVGTPGIGGFIGLIDYIAMMNNRPNDGDGMGGHSPVSWYNWYLRHGNFKPRKLAPKDERLLDVMLMNSDTRKVNQGMIGFANDKYTARELQDYTGKSVIIKWSSAALRKLEIPDPTLPDGKRYRTAPLELLVFSQEPGEEGREICTAHPADRFGYFDDPAAVEKIKEQNARIGGMKNVTKLLNGSGTINVTPGPDGEMHLEETQQVTVADETSFSARLAAKRKKSRGSSINDRVRGRRPNNDDDEPLEL